MVDGMNMTLLKDGLWKRKDDMIAGEKQKVMNRCCLIIAEMRAYLYAAEKTTTRRAREDIPWAKTDETGRGKF